MKSFFSSLFQMIRDGNVIKMAECYRTLLASLGENVTREGLLKTPERAAKALLFFTKGYEEKVSGEFIRILVIVISKNLPKFFYFQKP